jgi:acetyl esterase/lipase
MRRVIASLLCAAAAAACAAPPFASFGRGEEVTAAIPAETRAPISWRAILERPRETADERIAYGAGPSQFAELWLPRRPAPGAKAPVVILVHGGCWQAGFGLELMDLIAADLRDHGFAVWNIEYRRLGEDGGGYPGTFQDAAAAADKLRDVARTRPLDLTRVATVGHSAGGHLAAWLALRPALPETSPLRTPDPMPVNGFVSLAGVLDLADYRDNGPPACGVPATVDRLVDATNRPAPARWADTSPNAMVLIGPSQALLSAEKDPIVPPAFAERYGEVYVGAAAPTRVTYPGAGHFELIDPTSAVWPDVRERIARATR